MPHAEGFLKAQEGLLSKDVESEQANNGLLAKPIGLVTGKEEWRSTWLADFWAKSYRIPLSLTLLINFRPKMALLIPWPQIMGTYFSPFLVRRPGMQ